MAFTMYSYFNETTGDLVISGQEESLGEGYARLRTPSTNPTTQSEWPWYSKISSIKTVHIGTIPPIDVTSTNSMFRDCRSLTSLDLSSFDTSHVTNMNSMFYSCRSLTSLDLSNFDTSQVTYMDSMFNGCRKLTSLDLSSFNTSKVASMGKMFYNCAPLHVIDIPTTATNIVSELPDGAYYDVVTGTQYSNTDIPGGSTYVDYLSYTTSASGLMQTRKALNECSRSLNRRISAMRNLGEFEPEDSDRMYMVSSESDSESVDGRKVRRPCILAIVGSDPVRLAFAQ